MKKLFTILLVIVLGFSALNAQSPELFKYQTIVRNSSGEIIKNQDVAFRISIVSESPTGTSVYTETHSRTTNEFGLVNLEIGAGTIISGSFSTIDWATDNYFVKIELDIANGSNFTFMGTSQLLSVPYALHAKTVQNYTETDPVFKNSPANNITNNVISNWNNAYSWGNHAGLYRPISYFPSWTEITSKPSTLAGFGIMDAMNISHPAYGISASLINSWNNAYSWGNHAGLYKPITYLPSWTEITSKPSTLSGFGITDAINTSHPANNITSGLIENWNNAFSWGNHANEGYLKTESDPLFTNSPSSNITLTSISNWNNAFGWGNHAGLYRPVDYVPSWSEITANPFLFSSPANNQLIRFNSLNGVWENWTPNYFEFHGSPSSGDILYYNEPNWLTLPKGTEGQVLKLESGLPKWKQISEYGSVIPAANFVVSQLLGSTTQTISVDASSVIDDVDAPVTLEVRWRWEDSGTFSDWTTTKTATYIYPTEGQKNITLEVKDSHGNIGTASRGINIDNSFFIPLVFTSSASDITNSGAKCGGNVVNNGGSDITARGVCWSTLLNPTIANDKTTNGTGVGFFTSTISGLSAGTTYYIRAYATNSEGTSYGNQITIQTVLNVVFPTVTTTAITNITANAATSGGNVTATGGAEVSARGVCWSYNQNPTISDNITSDGTGTGQFQSQVSGLIPGGTYYLRAYATNSAGTGYGNQVTLVTLKTIPTVSTKNISSISPMGGVSGGTISSSGGGTISDKGICWSESENPTINDNKITAGAGITTFNSAISFLKPNTTCYVRAYAVNEIGIAYGDQKTFTTLDAFYDGFETGFSGTTGGWGIVTGNAIEGAYSLNSAFGGSEASLTRTLTNSGQIFFYAKLASSYNNIAFYIDGVLQGNYYNTFWGLQSYPVTAGLHTFKFKLIYSAFDPNAWIDFIVMPK